MHRIPGFTASTRLNEATAADSWGPRIGAIDQWQVTQHCSLYHKRLTAALPVIACLASLAPSFGDTDYRLCQQTKASLRSCGLQHPLKRAFKRSGSPFYGTCGFRSCIRRQFYSK